MINLVSESSVGSTNRRVESLVGLEAFRDLAAERAIVSQLTSNLKTPREQLPERIAELVAEPQGRREEDRRVRGAGARATGFPRCSRRPRRVGDVTLVAEDLGTLALRRRRADAGHRRPASGSAASQRSSPSAPRSASKAVVDRRHQPGGARRRRTRPARWPRRSAGILGGGGGGKDDLAQGGGTEVAAIPQRSTPCAHVAWRR